MSQSKKKQDFETQMERLQRVVTELEQVDLPLEKSVTLYQEGLSLVKACRYQLEKARQAVRLQTEEGPVPFAPQAEDEQ